VRSHEEERRAGGACVILHSTTTNTLLFVAPLIATPHANPFSFIFAYHSVLVDLPAETLLAYLFVQRTHEKVSENQAINGDLPRHVRENIDGTRSLHFTLTVHFPSPFTSRLFETWQTWSEIKSKNGLKKYAMGVVPIKEYPGSYENNAGDHKFTIGQTTGVYIIQEVAPNVCRWTRIQNVELNVKLPQSALNFLNKTQLGWANEVQERFRRNDGVVDKELRDALIQRTIGVSEEAARELRKQQLTEDQEAAFKVFDELPEEGWESLESPHASVKMEMHHKASLGRAETTADCTAEEACAWFFEFCSNERRRRGFQAGDLARLEIRRQEKESRVNEKTFALVTKMPRPLKNTEFVFKNILKRNEDGSVAGGIGRGAKDGRLDEAIAKALYRIPT